jgi:hypothetical protein
MAVPAKGAFPLLPLAMDTPLQEDRPLMNWLMTGLLALVGATLGGAAVSFITPKPQPQAAQKADSGAPTAEMSKGKAEGKHAASLPVTAPKQGPSAPPTPKPAETPNPPTASLAPKQPAAEPLVVAQAPATTEHEDQGEKPEAKKPAEDTEKHKAFLKAAKQVRLAMSTRDLTNTKRYLRTSGANAQSEADQAEQERLEILFDHIKQFWDGVEMAVAKLQPTEELVLGDNNRAIVVDADRSGLTVHFEGRNQHYRIDRLPIPLLSVIAKQSFKPTPGSKVVVGSFLAMDKEGDRKEAHKLWQEAAKAGESLGKDLMPELEIPLPR